MAQLASLEVQTQMRSPADKVFNIVKSKIYLLPSICPEQVKDIKLVKGDWESVGSVREWKYVAGMSESGTDTVESIDDGNMTITFDALSGEIPKYYKTFKAIFSVTPNGQGSVAKWTLVYEKQNQDVPDPNNYTDLTSTITKAIDAYLLKQ